MVGHISGICERCGRAKSDLGLDGWAGRSDDKRYLGSRGILDSSCAQHHHHHRELRRTAVLLSGLLTIRSLNVCGRLRVLAASVIWRA